ncbi:MAG TPA: hypothetical protein VD815_10885 [Candidatus Saccharimonadales bacterium]|nr:hypothetical protein [Candidatus Saccharimonadales bacterium]
MCSNIEDNKNLKIPGKSYGEYGFVGRNLAPYALLPLFFVIGLIVFIALPSAVAQTNFETANLNNNAVEISNEKDPENNFSLNSTFGNPNPILNPNTQNVTLLRSYSGFIDDINNKIRTESSIDNSLSNDSSSSVSNQTVDNEQTTKPSKLLKLKEITIQNTSMSIPAPVRHPGQPTHEVVFALPLRNDGYIWTGTVTFTASKPIEVEVLHTYVPLEKPDSLHGEPYYAVLPGNNSIAITHLRHLADVPIEINGTGISSGTLNFAGNALVFHKTTGEPFTVTYTIDAVKKKLSQVDS